MSNEVVIKVVSRSDTRTGFNDAKKDTEKFADETAEIYTKRFGERMKTLGEKLSGPLARSGQEIGKTLSERTTVEFQRGFSEKTVDLSKTVRVNITNRTEEITRAGQEIGDKLGTEIGKHSGETITENISQTVRTKLTQRVRESVRRIGDESHAESEHAGDVIGRDIGDRAGRTIRERITDHIKQKIKIDTDTDVSGSGDIGGKLGARFEKEGRALGDKLSTGIGGSLSSFFSGDLISLLVKVIAGGALVAALAPVLGAAISSAFLLAVGALPLAAGIIGALKDPRIKAATKDLKADIGSALEAFGRPFRAPVADFLEKLDRFLNSSAVRNAGKVLGDIFAPISGDIGNGVIGMLQNMLPGITDAAKAAAPLFETLAKHMPEIGQRLGDFFRDISESGPEANQFFDDFLTFVEKLIGLLGKVISVLATMYSVLRRMVTTAIADWHAFTRAVSDFSNTAKEVILRFTLYALDKFGLLLAGAATAFSWIPGIGPKLKRAEGLFNRFRNNVNAELAKIRNKTVKVSIEYSYRTFGKPYSTLGYDSHGNFTGGGLAHGGIKGAASGMNTNGLTLVGEAGPELAQLPPGTNVRSTGDSRRMMQQIGGQDNGMTKLILEAAPGLEATMVGVLVKALRIYIDGNGGNVQNVLGSAR